MACRLQLIWCSVLLQLVQSGIGSTVHWSSQFTRVSQCPTSHSELQQQQHCQSKMQCAALCSRDVNCGIFHFNHVTRTCFYGNISCHGLALWSDGPCASYRDFTKVIVVDPIVQQLSLKLLYRFATNGLVNVVDPCQFKLQPGSAGVPVDSDGAHFVENVNSYLITNTVGFENIVNKNNQYSMFVRAKHPLNIVPTYVAFRKCSTEDFTHDFYLEDNKVWDQAFWTPDGKSYRSKSANVYATSSVVSQVSVGVTFNMDHHDSFFFNGVLYPAVFDKVKPESGLQSSWFHCLHLGGFPEYSEYSVRGSMACFGLSTRLLTLAEFVQLDNWCKIK